MGVNVCIFTVTSGEEGVRLDVFLSDKLDSVSRNRIQKLNTSHHITVNSEYRADRYLVNIGDIIDVSLVDEEAGPKDPIPQEIALRVVYEDDHLIVVNKDAGLVVHPAHGNWEGTLINALLGRGTRLATQGGSLRKGIVHRLDKDTSGLLVVAKNDTAYKHLVEQIQARQVERVYHSIVWGHLGTDRLTIDSPIGRHPVHRQKMAVLNRGGKQALTEVFVLDSFNHFEYIRVVLSTVRTHQIRVHLAHIAHPVLGDPVYGGRRKKGAPLSGRKKLLLDRLLKIVDRQALHASVLSFTHPATGERVRFKTALPEDMRAALDALYTLD